MVIILRAILRRLHVSCCLVALGIRSKFTTKLIHVLLVPLSCCCCSRSGHRGHGGRCTVLVRRVVQSATAKLVIPAPGVAAVKTPAPPSATASSAVVASAVVIELVLVAVITLIETWLEP